MPVSQPGQTAAAGGPCRLVRHPMCSAIILMWLAAPVALGSVVALPAFCLLLPVLIFRLLNGEKFPRRELPGYADYCRRTACRLIPFVW